MKNQCHDVHCGHKHTEGLITVGSVRIWQTPSFCGTDAWSYGKLYGMGVKMGKYFLYGEESLQQQNYIYIPPEMYL